MELVEVEEIGRYMVDVGGGPWRMLVEVHGGYVWTSMADVDECSW